MEIISKLFSMVKQTVKESMEMDFDGVMRFALVCAVKLGFLYGVLFILSRFVEIKIG